MRYRNTLFILLFLTVVALFLGQNFVPFRHNFDHQLDFGMGLKSPPDLGPSPTPWMPNVDLSFHSSSEVRDAVEQMGPIFLNVAISQRGDFVEELKQSQIKLEKNLSVSPNDSSNWTFYAVKGTGSQLSYKGDLNVQCEMDYAQRTLQLRLLGHSNKSLSLEKDLGKDKSSVQLKMSW